MRLQIEIAPKKRPTMSPRLPEYMSSPALNPKFRRPSPSSWQSIDSQWPPNGDSANELPNGGGDSDPVISLFEMGPAGPNQIGSYSVNGNLDRPQSDSWTYDRRRLGYPHITYTVGEGKNGLKFTVSWPMANGSFFFYLLYPLLWSFFFTPMSLEFFPNFFCFFDSPTLLTLVIYYLIILFIFFLIDVFFSLRISLK